MNLLLRREVRGIEDLRQVLAGSDTEVTQLNGQTVSGTLRAMPCGADSLLNSGVYAGAVRMRGNAPAGCVTLNVNLAVQGDAIQWGSAVQPGDLVVLIGRSARDTLTRGRLAFAALTCPIAELLAHPAYQSVFARAVDAGTAIFRPPPAAARMVCAVFTTMLQKAAPEMGAGRLTEQATREMRSMLIEAFGAALRSATAHKREAPPNRQAADAIIGRIEAMLADGSTALRLADLCAETGWSRRTVHRVFASRFGVSPAHYLLLRRLSETRLALHDGAGTTLSVTDAARRHGFAELGRFAGQYRKLFGELPSATLRAG